LSPHLLEQSSASIHVLAGTSPQTKVMQADTLLHEAFASQSRIAGFDANRGSSANTVKKPIAIVDRLHAEFR
jgi:hypothetical protein